MPDTIQSVRARLFAMQDAQYQTFQQKLLPTLPPETVIGVRTPALRAYAKELAGTPEAAAFLAAAPHRYYEENNLHGFLLERERDFRVVLHKANGKTKEKIVRYTGEQTTCGF